MANICHALGPIASQQAFEKLAKTIKPGGKLAIIDFVPDSQRSQPQCQHGEEAPPAAALPRGQRVEFAPVGTLEEIMFGPSRTADGTMNLVGALRRAMATTGYTEVKEFQRIEVVVQH